MCSKYRHGGQVIANEQTGEVFIPPIIYYI
jgi:hypothetical protein